MTNSNRTPHRKTAREILVGLMADRPAPAFACRRCGTIGCRPELHEKVPAVRIPLVSRLQA